MSPLWRDEVGIYLAPRRVVLNRMSRGLRPSCVAQATIPVEGCSSTEWEPALSVLAAQLESAQWQDANVRVVVANHWVRYLMLPWSSELAGEDEWLAHGRLLLRDVFGDAVDGWTLALGETRPGRPQLACAMPAGLHDGLEQLLQGVRLRLLSLQPHLVVSFSRWRHRLPPNGWLMVVDDGAMAAVRLGNGSWQEVHCVRIGSDWSADLQRLRTFGRLAAGGVDSGRVLIEAPVWLRRVAADGDQSLEWLEPDEVRGGTLDDLARRAEVDS